MATDRYSVITKAMAQGASCTAAIHSSCLGCDRLGGVLAASRRRPRRRVIQRRPSARPAQIAVTIRKSRISDGHSRQAGRPVVISVRACRYSVLQRATGLLGPSSCFSRLSAASRMKARMPPWAVCVSCLVASRNCFRRFSSSVRVLSFSSVWMTWSSDCFSCALSTGFRRWLRSARPAGRAGRRRRSWRGSGPGRTGTATGSVRGRNGSRRARLLPY